MTQLIKVKQDLYYLDVRGPNAFGVSGIYLIVSDGITLIETGTSQVVPNIFEAIRELGYQEDAIKRVIVTHVHLDHSGGTGWLVDKLPDLEVYVHEKGLKHLHDPTALIESAKTVYGSLDAILTVHGEILPVPEKNLYPVLDTTLDIGRDKKLTIFDAPGHASHHLCIFDPENGALFSGEALGHHQPESGTIQPAVAPPGFNYEASLDTFEKINELNPAKICFSQYGIGENPKEIIEISKQQLKIYYDLTLDLLKSGKSTAETIEVIAEKLFGESGKNQGQSSAMLVSIVTGYEIYFRRKQLI